jgi:hypothetical protein
MIRRALALTLAAGLLMGAKPTAAAIWFTNVSPVRGDAVTVGYAYAGKRPAEVHVNCDVRSSTGFVGVWVSAFVPASATPAIRFGVGGSMFSPAPGLPTPPGWLPGYTGLCTAYLSVDNHWGSPSGLASSPQISVGG